MRVVTPDQARRVREEAHKRADWMFPRVRPVERSSFRRHHRELTFHLPPIRPLSASAASRMYNHDSFYLTIVETRSEEAVRARLCLAYRRDLIP